MSESIWDRMDETEGLSIMEIPPDDNKTELEATVKSKEKKAEGKELEIFKMPSLKSYQTKKDVEDEEVKVEKSKVKQNEGGTEDASKRVKKVSNYDEYDEYIEHITYTKEGIAVYTDPETHIKYRWSTKQNSWVICDDSLAVKGNPFETEHYKWCHTEQKWLPKGQPAETEHYKWDAAKNEWVAKAQKPAVGTEASDKIYEIDEKGQRIYTDEDGVVFFWDAEKKAWFPKIDEDFMAQYQMNYGFIDNTSKLEEERKQLAEKEAKRKEEELKKLAEEAKRGAEEAAAAQKGLLKRKAQEPPKWFDMDPSQNTKVYVWNLPLDINLEEFAELMGKCGMIMRDPQTQKYKLKLYTEADGQIKGDGLCDYIKVESVDLALKILDEYNYRGHKIRVQRAKFQMRGEYNPSLKPKRKKKDKEKLQKIKEKLFDWRPEKMRGERSKNEKVVILRNLFDPEIFEKEVHLILDYQNDLREECSKCGTVRKVVIYDRHPEGIAQVNMSSIEEADVVIKMMDGRFFGKRKLQAEHWDGKTKYKSFESETEEQKRLSNWDKFLHEDEDEEQVDSDETDDKIKEIQDERPAKRKRERQQLETLEEVENEDEEADEEEAGKAKEMI